MNSLVRRAVKLILLGTIGVLGGHVPDIGRSVASDVSSNVFGSCPVPPGMCQISDAVDMRWCSSLCGYIQRDLKSCDVGPKKAFTGITCSITGCLQGWPVAPVSCWELPPVNGA